MKRENSSWRRWLWILAGVCIVAVGAWAQEKKNGREIEGNVRQAGFLYYVGTVLGDPDLYLKAARLPLYVVKDGEGAHRTEKEARALLGKIAEQMKAAKLSDEERGRITANMLAAFEQADVQFIGANTAALTFLITSGSAPGKGDRLGTLIMHQKEGRWQVIAEVTDSAPVPPEYLVDVAKQKEKQ